VRSRLPRNLALLILLARALPAGAQTGGELHFCLHGEPKTFNPILVDDEPSENIRYLTRRGPDPAESAVPGARTGPGNVLDDLP
jgi:hypothetical protein